MANYVEAFKGYIADVPKMFFSRCDGKKFAFAELTSASVTPNIETNEIRGGWSLFPLAVLPAGSTFEMNVTSAQFDPEIFSMANATDYELNEKYEVPTVEKHTLNTNKQITLLRTPIDGTIYIKGLEQTTNETPEEGYYHVNKEFPSGTLVTFNSEYAGTSVEVIYKYESQAMEAIIDNKSSAIGEAVCVWPVRKYIRGFAA